MIKNNNCGLDGHGEHCWRYSERTRKCAYCLKIQLLDGEWVDDYTDILTKKENSN